MSQVHGGNVWELARRQKLPLEEIIDFSANINPLGISQKAEAAIRDNINKIIHYPDPDCLEFSAWTNVFLEKKMTAALLDRLTHQARVVLMNGESYRFKHSLGTRKGVKNVSRNM